MKFLSALILCIVVSFLTLISAYCNDSALEENQLIGVVAGKIWNQRRSFNIEQVDVNKGKIKVIIIEMTREIEAEIRKIAKPFEVTFVNKKFEGRDSILYPKNLFLQKKKIM